MSERRPASALLQEPLSILLAEDDVDLRGVLELFLRERTGFQVAVVEDGTKALEHVIRRGGAYDLLLLNHCMPGFNGAEVARIARQAQPGVPILLYSGCTEDQILGEVGDGSWDAFLQAPFRLPELLCTMIALRRSAGRAERRRVFDFPSQH